MLTPKHRALFAAAYSAPLLRTSGEETEPGPAPTSQSEPGGEPAGEPRSGPAAPDDS